MENNENANIIKYQKLKIHFVYIIIIGFILCFGSIVLALYSKDDFVAQVSFGGTITSIVLSVIAILMSISGERTTSDIRVKIAESTEKLSGTTKEIETFNNNYKETMNTQLAELKNVQEQLTQIISSVEHVDKQVSIINGKSTISSNTLDNNIMNTSQRIALFNYIYTWTTYNDYYREWIFCKMVEIFIIKRRTLTPFTIDDIFNSLAQANININFWMVAINTFWGIINTLLAASVFDDPNAANQIQNIINNKLYPQSPNPIN